MVCPEPAASAAASDSGRRLCALVWGALGPAAGSQHSHTVTALGLIPRLVLAVVGFVAPSDVSSWVSLQRPVTSLAPEL